METAERQHISIEDEMRRSYLDYAMSVIIGRALPDVRDGLKPVHRRVLWAMNELGNTYNKAYKKSARVVGDVIGKYHPHGDTAVYDTIVRLAQDFSMRYPLIDGQGNFGSVDGDAPAAMRYTEVRMAKLANELLADIEKETVTFQPNYDESLSEPTVLPARIPSLLINGSDGIALRIATKIAAHNLTEIGDATIAVLRDPEIDIEDLLKIVKGPDFPTRGFICGREEIRNSYLTGRGILQMRARAAIDRSPGAHLQNAAAGEIGIADLFAATDKASRGKVGALDDLEQVFDVDFRIAQDRDSRIADLSQIVRGDLCRNPEGNSIRAVNQKTGNSRRQDRRFA